MKKYIILLFIVFFSSVCHAQVQTNLFYEISDFSEMLNSQVSPFILQNGSATQADNVRANEQFGSLAKRDTMLLYGTCRSAAVKSMHRYYKSDATKYLLATSSTYLDLGDENGGACTELTSGLTDGKRWTFVALRCCYRKSTILSYNFRYWGYC